MPTLSELKRNDWRKLNRQAPEKRAASIEALKYIELLAQQSSTAIALWNISEIFCASGLNFVTDKGEINRRFFEHKAKCENGNEETIKQLQEQIKTTLAPAIYASKTIRIRHLQSRINEAKNAAAEAHRRVTHRTSEAYRMSCELMALQSSDDQLGAQLVAIVQDRFWLFQGIAPTGDNQAVDFMTQNEVVLTQKNTAAGINQEVNLGRFIARINLTTGTLSVLPALEQGGNVRIPNSEIYHPHVNAGSVCWGNASDSASEALCTGQLRRAMQLLAALLTTYSAERPYASLNEFEKQIKAGHRIQAPDETASHEVQSEEDERAIEEFNNARVSIQGQPYTFTVSATYRGARSGQAQEEAQAGSAQHLSARDVPSATIINQSTAHEADHGIEF